MGLYRCAACGSQNVVTDTQSDGIQYNYAKGAIGSIAFGAVGAVAGLENKTQQVYKCQDCGITLSYCMPENLKMAIDFGVMNVDARENIKIGSMYLDWEFLKRQYKNIESGLADRCIEMDRQAKMDDLYSVATATEEEFNKAVDFLKDFEKRFDLYYQYKRPDCFTDDKPMMIEEYIAWHSAIAVVVKNMAKFIPNFDLGVDIFDVEFSFRDAHSWDIARWYYLYLFEHMRQILGYTPVIVGVSIHTDCRELEEFATDNPFVVHLANLIFLSKKRTYFDNKKCCRLTIDWEANTLAKLAINTMQFDSGASCRFITYYFKIGDTSFTCAVMGYTVQNGLLCRIHHKQRAEADEVMETYFSCYPQKKTEYDTKIEERKNQLAHNTALKQEKEKLQKTITSNQSEVSKKLEAVDGLRKKIFGRKKAAAEIDILEQEIAKLREDIKQMEGELKNIPSKMHTNIPDDETFCKQLAKDMDYFAVWQVLPAMSGQSEQ